MAHTEIEWEPSNPFDPGPCISVVVMNSSEFIEAGRAIGLEFPAPHPIKALLDTGAAVTVISKTFARFCKLRQTSAGTELRVLGSRYLAGEHAGAISFPGTKLRTFDPIRIVSADFEREPNYACLIGRDIIRHWNVSFDGRNKRITIID